MELTVSRLTAAAAGIAIAIAGTAAISKGLSDRPGAVPQRAAPIAEQSILPRSLRDTGLYADWTTNTVAPANRPFTPQYPLWTDGATKRRWIYLPPGTQIDASAPDAWQFPIGTRLWKEFSFGRRAETRYMERTAAGWRYASYVWTADGSDALLTTRAVRTDASVAAGVQHVVPGERDCRACHANGPTPVLGFSALQLSPDRDPHAVHREPVAADAIDLTSLVTNDQLRDWPAKLVAPRIEARSADERAALGYLHGNCGGCHRTGSAIASLGMVLEQSVIAPTQLARSTTIDQPSKFTVPGTTAGTRIVPGDPGHSVLLARINARTALLQMPPLGSQLVDDEAITLLSRWITQLKENRL